MSVINTMLKDLESRGVECEKSDNAILGGLSANKQTIMEKGLSSNAYFISLISVFSILAIMVTVYFILPYKMVYVAQENVARLPGNTESSEIETQANNKKPAFNPVLIEHNTAAAATSVVAQSALASVSVTKPAPAINSSLAAAKSERQVAAKTAGTTSVVQSTNKHSSVAEISVTEGKRQQIKPPVIEQAAKTLSAATREAVLVEAEIFDETDEALESLEVVNKKQRDYTPQEKSRQAYATASSLYNEGSKQQAKASLKQAIAFSVANRDAYSLLAVIYLEDGRADLASEIIENGLSKHSDDQALLRLYLQSLVQQAKYKEAITVMEQRLRLTSPEDLGYLAGLYQKQNDHLNAVKLYTRALQLKPSTSLWWMGQGISLEGIEKHEEALQSYQQSISTGQLSGKLAKYAASRIKTIKQFHADFVS